MPQPPVAFIALAQPTLRQLVQDLLHTLGDFDIQVLTPDCLPVLLDHRVDLLFWGSSLQDLSLVQQVQDRHPEMVFFVVQEPGTPAPEIPGSILQVQDLQHLLRWVDPAHSSLPPQPRLLSPQNVPRVFEHIPALIYRYRLHPRPGFEYLNASSTPLTGYTPEEHQQDPQLLLKVVHPDDRPLLDWALNHPQDAHTLVLRLVHRDGQVLWMELHQHVVHENGRVVAFEGMARDITARVQAEQQQTLLSVALEQADSAVAITCSNLQGGIAEVLYVNQAFVQLFGYPLQEAMHSRLKDLLHPQFGPDTDLWVKQSLLQGRTATGSTFMQNRHGQLLHVAWSLTPVKNSAGATTHFVYLFRDQTEQHLQQHLQQVENQILSQLVRNTSLQEALDHLCQGLEHLYRGVRASILRFDAPARHLVFAAGPSYTPREHIRLVQGSMQASRCPAVQAALQQHLPEVPAQREPPTSHSSTREPGVLCVPILGQHDRLLGVLSIESQGVFQFPDWLNTAVNRLADVAAMALERQEAQQQVFEHARVFQGLFEHARDAIVVIKVQKDGRFVYSQVNPMWCLQTGLQPAGVLGRTAMDIFPEQAARLRQEHNQWCVLRCEAVQFEENFQIGQHQVHWLTQLVPVLDATGKVDVILSSSRDISTIRQAEHKLLKLNRLYTLLSETNQVMVRSQSQQQLFDEVCQVAVQEGGLRLAWVSVWDREGQALLTAACNENSLLPLRDLRVDLSSHNPHRGMSSRAVLENRAVVVNDTLHSEITRPWQEVLRERHLLAAASYPLHLHGEVMGCINFFATEKGFFEADTHNLFLELSSDLSFALDHLHNEQLRRKLEHDLLQREERLRSLVESQSTFLLRTDLRGDLTFANQAFLQRFGYTEQHFLTLNMQDLLLPEDQQRVVRVTQLCLARPGQPYPVTVRLRDPRGELREVECEFVAVQGAQSPGEIQVMGIDRTEHRKAEEARLEAERRLHTSIDHFPGIFAIVDLDFRILYVNRAGAQITGRTDPAELIGQNVTGVAGDRFDTLQQFLEALETCKATCTLQDMEVYSAALDLTFQVTCVPVHSRETFSEILVVVSDLTEERRRDARMRLLSRVVEESPSMVVITDPHGQVEYVNQKYLEVHGHARASQDGTFHQDGWQDMWEVLASGQVWQGELEGHTVQGDVTWERVSAFPIRNLRGELEHFVRLSEDITSTKTLQARLDYLAYHDPLTGLPNRQLLLDRMGQEVQHSSRAGLHFAVVLLDLDQFKIINDTHGHTFGDEMLKQVTLRLQGCTRPGDTISRQGGDEFLLLLSGLQDGPEAAVVATRVLESFRQPFNIEGQEFFMTASLGISVYPTDGTTPEELIQHADTALNRTKQEGRNSYQFFEPQMNQTLHERMIIENGIRRGVERGEFFLLYQPRVDLQTGQIREVEALVRWNHPRLGLIPPLRFIPLAEETGAILPLGTFVLEEACRQASLWRDRGAPLPISVNISARQFHLQDLPGLISGLLSQHRLSPSLLRLEITESLMIQDVARTIEVLQALRTLGIGVEIDDFGTGYSSLSYLHQLPITALKIDRSFLKNIEQSEGGDAGTLVEAILGLGRTLNLEVVAEGVETEIQKAFLLQRGCCCAQGYLFSPPVAPEQIARRFLNLEEPE